MIKKYAGDNYEWEKAFDEQGIITYYFSSASNSFKVSATETSGTRKFSVTLPDKAVIYTYQIVATSSGKQKTIGQGQFEILPSFTDEKNHDNEMWQEQAIANIKKYLQNPNSIEAKKAEVDGKALERYSLREVTALLARLEQQVQSERNKIAQQAGQTTPASVTRIKVK